MVRLVPIWLAVAVLGLVAGCGGAADDPAPEPERAPVDPNYVSAESLTSYAKGLLDADPPQLEAFYDLFLWENKKQQMYYDLVKTLVVPRAKFEKATHGRLDSDPVKRSLRLEPITIADPAVSVAGDRATANFQLGDDTHTLHLIQFDRRWWIAGQTVEETPAMVCPPHPLEDRTDFILGELREAIFHLQPLGQAYTAIAAEASAKSDEELPGFIKEKIRIGVLDYATRANLTPRDIP